MIDWVWPLSFLALPLPLVVRLLSKRQARPVAALSVPNLVDFQEVIEHRQTDSRNQWVRLTALFIIWLLLITAIARPQWIGDPVSLPTTGRDLMLAVDISGSMATEDMVVQGDLIDRLSVVKAVIAEFIAARGGDRVGLILFGTNAYLQAPLTFDLKSLESLLMEAPVGIAGGKTAIGDAIGLAVKRLRERPQEEKVLILLTDGANNVGEVEPEKAAELAARDGIRIYTVGVGAEEMRVPGLLGRLTGRVSNPSADLDEQTLEKIAGATGGRYFRAKDPQTLLAIYDLIDELEPVDQEAEIFRPTQALYYWPLAISLILFCLLLLFDLIRARHAQEVDHAS
ncbi:MAG TPA: BatB protein [Gammaproteobacteria bacterium]|nr:MAG: VWA domain-containing protein [Gammaproteobacteria bacterium TMED134]HAL41942.1 BatB protein [Gammaproteobacteria bacterium]|tara:strand:- start:3347 stop:4369 length:1023 start_codon:yes stop_codon:yes gene_type:complete